jgi:hypothetical protein
MQDDALVYVVTANEDFYPSKGLEDVVFVHTELRVARSFVRGAKLIDMWKEVRIYGIWEDYWLLVAQGE